MDQLLEPLNPQQREAVQHTQGPLLIVAGAGSGKTRVIVHRLAYVLAGRLASPSEIVAVTFTNKVAGEMRDRVDRLVGADHGGAQVSTFHSWCLRLLRRHATLLGYGSDFQVYDSADQTSLVKECLATLRIDDQTHPPRSFRHRISDAKNRGLDPQAFTAEREGFRDDLTSRVYALYQKKLRSCNAMDFDDLIGQAIVLLEDHPDVLSEVAGAVRYLMVDEYQDTNPPQYRLIRLLTSIHGNVCAVGDPDQSIYRFRFADINNILSFEQDFPGTRIIKLEQNYRSTGNILRAASSMVRHNRSRIDKTLWSDAADGEPVELLVAADERHEAGRVVSRVADLRARHELDDIAVLYRTNAQSRSIEEALTRAGLPYIIVGGTRFYDRREVKDVLAYLRALLNPRDEVSLRRIVNVPPRDIGKTTLETVLAVLRDEGLLFEEAIHRAVTDSLVARRAGRALRGFLDLMADLRREAAGVQPSRLVERIIKRTGFESHLEATSPGDATARIENLQELVTAISAYDGLEGGLQAFLDRTALLSETENVQGTTGVRLMTLHSAKGLEFSVVFIVGVEEDLCPHVRSVDEQEEVEEERRLFYVGMTRARTRLILSRAVARRQFGEARVARPSRFLREIPADLVRVDEDAGGWPRLRAGGRDGRRPGRRQEPGSARHWTETDDPVFQVEDVPAGPYTLGCKVQHPEYGVGTVIGIEGTGDTQKLTVSFSIYGSKKFLPRFAQLEKI